MPFLLFFTFYCSDFSAQSLKDFKYLGDVYNDELYLGLYPTYTNSWNKVAPNAEKHKLSGFSGEFSMRKIRFDQGKSRWSWQHKLFIDIWLILNQALQKGNDQAIYRNEETAFSNGIIGWIDYTVNINKPDNRFLMSLGINHNDYFYATTYAVDTLTSGESWASFNPQGYYLAAGPSIILNYLPLDFLMIELSTSYSFSYVKAVDLSYATYKTEFNEMPHWGQVDLELQTAWGFFSGFNYNWIINRNIIPSKGKRLDLLMGFRFML